MIYHVTNPESGVRKEPLEKAFSYILNLSISYANTIYIYVGKLGIEEAAVTLIFSIEFWKELNKYRVVTLNNGITIHLVHPRVISNIQNGVIVTLFSQPSEVSEILNNLKFNSYPKVHIPWSQNDENKYLSLFPNSQLIH